MDDHISTTMFSFSHVLWELSGLTDEPCVIMQQFEKGWGRTDITSTVQPPDSRQDQDELPPQP